MNEYYELRVFVPRSSSHYIRENDVEALIEAYKSHIKAHNENIVKSKYKDAGFDLLMPNDYVFNKVHSTGALVDLNIRCAMYKWAPYSGTDRLHPSSYFLYPRSSTGTKTPLRLANSVGIIDAGYRGNIKACVDCNNFNIDISMDNQLRVEGNNHFTAKRHNRYFQICAPNLNPITVKLVGTETELNLEEETTERGEGGFGSSG